MANWCDAWTFRFYGKDGNGFRSNNLTAIFKAIGETDFLNNKPANETGFVIDFAGKLKSMFDLEKVDCFFEGNLQLSA